MSVSAIIHYYCMPKLVTIISILQNEQFFFLLADWWSTNYAMQICVIIWLFPYMEKMQLSSDVIASNNKLQCALYCYRCDFSARFDRRVLHNALRVHYTLTKHTHTAMSLDCDLVRTHLQRVLLFTWKMSIHWSMACDRWLYSDLNSACIEQSNTAAWDHIDLVRWKVSVVCFGDWCDFNCVCLVVFTRTIILDERAECRSMMKILNACHRYWLRFGAFYENHENWQKTQNLT